MIDEINQAIELEGERYRGDDLPEILFAICLEDVTMDIWKEYHQNDQPPIIVYDFRNWNEANDYQPVFKELTKDLRIK